MMYLANSLANKWAQIKPPALAIGLLILAIGLLIAGWGALVSPAAAQSLDTLSQSAQAATSDGAASQTRINALDEETDQITRDYRAAVKQLTALREYNAQLLSLIHI